MIACRHAQWIGVVAGISARVRVAVPERVLLQEASQLRRVVARAHQVDAALGLVERALVLPRVDDTRGLCLAQAVAVGVVEVRVDDVAAAVGQVGDVAVPVEAVVVDRRAVRQRE